MMVEKQTGFRLRDLSRIIEAVYEINSRIQMNFMDRVLTGSLKNMINR